MAKTCWMITTSLENYNVTQERGFDMIGIDSRNARKAAQMVPGDRLVFYVRDSKRFAATATVKSERFQGQSKIWNHHSEREEFKNRVRIEPDYVVDEHEQQIDAYQVGPTLEYVKRWIPEHWDLAFFGMVHILSQRDFDLLEGELKRATNGVSLNGTTERQRNSDGETSESRDPNHSNNDPTDEE